MWSNPQSMIDTAVGASNMSSGEMMGEEEELTDS